MDSVGLESSNDLLKNLNRMLSNLSFMTLNISTGNHSSPGHFPDCREEMDLFTSDEEMGDSSICIWSSDVYVIVKLLME